VAPSDVIFLGPSHGIYQGQHFLNDDVIAVVMTWLQACDQDFFARVFNKLVSHWEKCLKKSGDNIKIML
jgi:hypothetical protein